MPTTVNPAGTSAANSAGSTSLRFQYGPASPDQSKCAQPVVGDDETYSGSGEMPTVTYRPWPSVATLRPSKPKGVGAAVHDDPSAEVEMVSPTATHRPDPSKATP